MPTGYTAKLCEGDQSFEEFVWACARAMGGLIHMRDDPLDVPIRRPEPSWDSAEDQQKEVEKAQRELVRVKKSTEEQIAQELEAQNQKQMREHKESVARHTLVRDRLLRMKSQVADWGPPTKDHEGLKKFMIQQLDETINFDGEIPDPPELETDIEEWRRLRIEWAQRDIDYYTKKRVEAAVRCKSRTDWMGQLEASVEIPPSLQIPIEQHG